MGSSFGFDGSSGSIALPSGGVATTFPATVEAWVYVPDAAAKGAVIKLGDINSGWGMGCGVNGGGSWDTSDSTTPRLTGLFETVAWEFPGTSADMTAGAWNHCAITVDSAANSYQVYVYINGVQRNVGSGTTPVAPANKFTVGADDIASGSKRYFAGETGGRIAKVAVYNKVLSSSRISAHASAGSDAAYDSAVLTDGPLGYWKLEDSSTSSPADSSGNGNSATGSAGGLTAGLSGPFAADTPTVSAPTAAITGNRPWWIQPPQHQQWNVVFQAANPPEYPVVQLPSAAIQKGWWAPVWVLQPTSTIFTPASNLEQPYTMAPFPAVQQGMAPWQAPVVHAQYSIAPFQGPNPPEYPEWQVVRPPILQGMEPWRAPIVHAQYTIAPFQAPNPPEYPEWQVTRPPVLQGNLPWQAPIVLVQARFTSERSVPPATDSPVTGFPQTAIQQSWWAPIVHFQSKAPIEFGIPPAPDSPVTQFPIAAVQQPWWAKVPQTHPTTAPTLPGDYPTSQFPLAAVQQGWWSPVVRARQTNAVFQAAAPVPYPTSQLPIRAIQQPWWSPMVMGRSSPPVPSGTPATQDEPIVLWRHRAHFQ